MTPVQATLDAYDDPRPTEQDLERLGRVDRTVLSKLLDARQDPTPYCWSCHEKVSETSCEPGGDHRWVCDAKLREDDTVFCIKPPGHIGPHMGPNGPAWEKGWVSRRQLVMATNGAAINSSVSRLRRQHGYRVEWRRDPESGESGNGEYRLVRRADAAERGGGAG